MARPKKAVTKAMLKQYLKDKFLFKKHVSKHPLVNEPDYVAHAIEPSKRKQDVFELDPNVDGKSALHFMKWGEPELIALWEGILYRSLSILRYESNAKAIEEELDWIASNQFDLVIGYFGLNANEIRILVTQNMRNVSLSQHSNALLRAFRCLNG